MKFHAYNYLAPMLGPVLQSDFDNQEAFSDQSFIAPGQESSEIEDIASKSQGHNHVSILLVYCIIILTNNSSHRQSPLTHHWWW